MPKMIQNAFFIVWKHCSTFVMKTIKTESLHLEPDNTAQLNAAVVKTSISGCQRRNPQNHNKLLIRELIKALHEIEKENQLYHR